MKRRQLRLLRAVSRIELLACDSEDSALARESELLKNIRPKFNRAGTWPGTRRFLLWRVPGAVGRVSPRGTLEIGVSEQALAGWQSHGPMGSSVITLRNVLARLLWRTAHPQWPLSKMPAGWWHGKLEAITEIAIGSASQEISQVLDRMFSETPEPAIEELAATVSQETSAFEKAAMALDLEWLITYLSKRAGRPVEPTIPGTEIRR
jgi:hypothetical protein